MEGDSASALETGSARVRLGHEERRQQLIDACAYLIATKGYSRTSVRDVAAQVGISTGTLLHHFASKEELLIATLLAVSDDFVEDIQGASAGAGDAVDALRRLVRAILGKDREVGWRVWIAFWHEASTNRQLARVASERSDLADAMLTDLIEQGRRDGVLRVAEPSVAAAELAILIDGVALRIYGESGRWTPERAIGLVERVIDRWAVVT